MIACLTLTMLNGVAVGPASAALPTGTFTETGGGGSCWPGFSCSGFRVTCSGLKESATGDMARRTASNARGTVVFFQDGGGAAYVRENADTEALMENLHDAGFTLVQIRWDEPWYKSAAGESAGFAKVACRPATVVKWVEQHLYVERSHAGGACGFCLMGVSGGASAISYTTTYYGMDSIVDALIMAGGPPHAAMAKGCLGTGGAGYLYPKHTATNMDDAYGFAGSGGGPCEQRDEGFVDRWNADSPDTGGSDYASPATRFTFLFGDQDNTVGPPHGRDFADKIESVGSADVREIAGMPHEPYASAAGLAAVKSAILGSGGAGGSNNGGGSGGSGSDGPGSGGSGSGGSGSGGSASPTATATPTVTASAAPSGSATDAPGIALPVTETDQRPWSILLLAIAPVVAFVLYRVLSGQPLVPRRRRHDP